MKRVSEVAWEDLRIGDPVISAIGNFGQITKIYKDTRYSRNDVDGDMVEMLFHSGIRDVQRHYMCDHVGYFEVVLAERK